MASVRGVQTLKADASLNKSDSSGSESGKVDAEAKAADELLQSAFLVTHDYGHQVSGRTPGVSAVAV